MASPPHASIKATGNRRQVHPARRILTPSNGPHARWPEWTERVLAAVDVVFPSPATCSEVATQVPAAGLQMDR